MPPAIINPLRRRGCKRVLLYMLVCLIILATLEGMHLMLGINPLNVFGPGEPGPLTAEEPRSVPTSPSPTSAKPAVKRRSRRVCERDSFADGVGCRPCHAQCVGCAGHGDEACFECHYSKDGGRCVDKCPKARPYRGGLSGKWCVSRCPSGQHPDADGKCGKRDSEFANMVKLNTADGKDSRRQWHFDPSINLDYPKAALTTYNSVSALESSRFLLPLLPYGPNNQYRGFKESIMAARYLNRTLVLPPFFNHYSVSLPGHMPASKRHLAERIVMAPQETFDIATLADAVPVVSWRQFEEACGGQVSVEYHCRPEHDVNVERSFYFYRVTRLSTDHAERIYLHKVLKDWFLTPARELVEKAFSTSHRCAVLAFPYRTLTLTGQDYSFLSKHLFRSVQTRQAASIVWQGLLRGQKYLAVHWRFNSEWGRFWCKQTNPFHYNVSQVPANMRPECKVLAATNQQVLQTVQDIMARHKITHVYMAVMTQMKGLVQLLKKHIKHLILAENIRASVDISGNYALSLVEQEVCSGAEVFVGSTKSSWSQNVVDERYGSGKQDPLQNLWWHRIM